MANANSNREIGKQNCLDTVENKRERENTHRDTHFSRSKTTGTGEEWEAKKRRIHF